MAKKIAMRKDGLSMEVVKEFVVIEVPYFVPVITSWPWASTSENHELQHSLRDECLAAGRQRADALEQVFQSKHDIMEMNFASVGPLIESLETSLLALQADLADRNLEQDLDELRSELQASRNDCIGLQHNAETALKQDLGELRNSVQASRSEISDLQRVHALLLESVTDAVKQQSHDPPLQKNQRDRISSKVDSTGSEAHVCPQCQSRRPTPEFSMPQLAKLRAGKYGVCRWCTGCW